MFRYILVVNLLRIKETSGRSYGLEGREASHGIEGPEHEPGRDQQWVRKMEKRSRILNDVISDGYGFEYTYSIIFSCYQTVNTKIISKLKRGGSFPFIHCRDNFC